MDEPAGVRRVPIDTGITVAFRETGATAGPVLVLLHAWAESSSSFVRLIPALPSGLHVFAMDMRGHGDSDKPPHGYGLLEVADDVRAFMDAVRIDSAVLVGASSGGYVAQQLALEHPERVDGLVLAGSPASLQGRPDFTDQINALVDPIDVEWAQDFVSSFPVLTAVPAWYLEDRVIDAVRIPAAVWKRSLEGLTTAVPPMRSGGISARALAIWGSQDAVTDAAGRAGLCAALPRAACREYAGVGHLVLWETPGRLAADIAAFVDQVAASGSSSPG